MPVKTVEIVQREKNLYALVNIDPEEKGLLPFLALHGFEVLDPPKHAGKVKATGTATVLRMCGTSQEKYDAWRVETGRLDPYVVPDAHETFQLQLTLRAHHERALSAWFHNGYKGIVEMFPGTGKTVVGLAVVERYCAHLLDHGTPGTGASGAEDPSTPGEQGAQASQDRRDARDGQDARDARDNHGNQDGKGARDVENAQDGRDAPRPLRVLVLCNEALVLDQWRREFLARLAPTARPAEPESKNDARSRHFAWPPVTAPLEDGRAVTIEFATLDRLVEEYKNGVLDEVRETYAHDLLLADDVHRADAPALRMALRVSQAAWLGLGATIDGTQQSEVSCQHIGDVVFSFGAADAIASDLLPPVHVVPGLAPLARGEVNQAAQLTNAVDQVFRRKVKGSSQTLKNLRRCDPNAPKCDDLDAFRELMALARHYGQEPMLPNEWPKLAAHLASRREVLHGAHAKTELAVVLAATVGTRRKVVVFHADRRGCRTVRQELQKRHVAVDYLHAGQGEAKQARVARQFRERPTGVLVTPDYRDAGLYFPAVGVIISATVPDAPLELVHHLGRLARAEPGHGTGGGPRAEKTPDAPAHGEKLGAGSTTEAQAGTQAGTEAEVQAEVQAKGEAEDAAEAENQADTADGAENEVKGEGEAEVESKGDPDAGDGAPTSPSVQAEGLRPGTQLAGSLEPLVTRPRVLVQLFATVDERMRGVPGPVKEAVGAHPEAFKKVLRGLGGVLTWEDPVRLIPPPPKPPRKKAKKSRAKKRGGRGSRTKSERHKQGKTRGAKGRAGKSQSKTRDLPGLLRRIKRSPHSKGKFLCPFCGKSKRNVLAHVVHCDPAPAWVKKVAKRHKNKPFPKLWKKHAR